MYRYILFDLDGTLSDPKVGICTSVQYALNKMGIEAPDIDELEPFIGPPLRDSFMEYYNMTAEEAEQAITYYRERFSTIGKFENEIYPGIPELLKDLKKKGRTVAIASSKPTVFVEDILKHFEIREYFDVVVGSELDGSRDKKEDVLKETLRQMFPDSEIEYDEVVMIGDRKFDINAAHEIGTQNIGVSYGYGSREELEEAGADKIVNTVAGLRATLLPLVGEKEASYQMRTTTSVDPDTGKKMTAEELRAKGKEASKKNAANMWGALGPMLIYWIGVWLMQNVLYVAISMLFGLRNNEIYDSAMAFYGIKAVSGLFPCILLRKPFKGLSRKAKEQPMPKLSFAYEPLAWAAIVVILSVGIAGWGLNLDAQIAKLAAENTIEAAETATSTAVDQSLVMPEIPPISDLPLWIGILFYGLMIPSFETFVFTGIAYRKAKSFMQPGFALLIVAVIYAYVRGESATGISGLVVFVATLYAFSVFPKIWYALAVDIVGTTIVYVIKSSEALSTKFVNSTGDTVSKAVVIAATIAIIALSLIKKTKESEDKKAVM